MFFSVSCVFARFPECAKSFLSVVPGKFMLFDKDTPAQNMKDAERSTYTFISEMEEGGSVSAQDLVKVRHATHMRCCMPVYL